MAKKQINAKQVGKNIIVIDGETKYSKAIETPEERKVILEQVKQYNEKNDAKLLKKIISSLETKKQVVKKEKPIKIVPIKEEKKKELKKEVVEEKKKEIPVQQYTQSHRRGEY